MLLPSCSCRPFYGPPWDAMARISSLAASLLTLGFSPSRSDVFLFIINPGCCVNNGKHPWCFQTPFFNTLHCDSARAKKEQNPGSGAAST